jgi:hypothetical protein
VDAELLVWPRHAVGAQARQKLWPCVLEAAFEPLKVWEDLPATLSFLSSCMVVIIRLRCLGLISDMIL